MSDDGPSVDDDLERAPGADDVVERLGDERQVPGQDAIADVVAGHARIDEVVTVGLERDDVLERRVPDGLGELVSEELLATAVHT